MAEETRDASPSRSTSPPRKVQCGTGEGFTAARRWTRSSVERNDLKKCIICQDEKTLATNRRVLERLTRCEGDTTPATLCNAARVWNDKRVLLDIDQQDLWAKDIMYHPSCYATYTSPRALKYRLRRDMAAEDNGKDANATERAFDALAQHVSDTIVRRPDTVTNMSALCCTFVNYLQREGVEMDSYRTCLLKARLKARFGDALSFHRPQKRNMSEYVFNSNVPAGPLVEKCALALAAADRAADESLSVEDIVDVRAAEVPTPAMELYKAALFLRSEVKALKNKMPFPPKPTDLAEDNVQVPSALYNFLVWLLVGDTEADGSRITLDRVKPPASSVDQRHIMSLAQDMIHTVTKGRVKTAKHVALPIAVKQMTGSAQTVTLLNHFGCGLSKSQISEIETAMAENIVQQQQQQTAFVPSNISKGSFVHFCWDNNDINEETLSGRGTTHCTNGIAIQRRVLVQCMQPEESHTVTPDTAVRFQATTKGRRHRSINPPPEMEIEYNAGVRQGPLPIPLADDVLSKVSETCKSTVDLSPNDMAWLLARLKTTNSAHFGQAGGQQKTPSWTAFNVSVADKNMVRPCVVGYLPVIPASPTELSTVYVLLKRSLATADELEQHDVVITLDQAIYAKAQEIICKHPDEFSRVVLRLGSFHIVGTLLAVIGQRFSDAGLHDLLLESGLVGPSAVTAVLKGKHYNRGVRCHKVVLEALLRLLWLSFEAWLNEQSLLTDSDRQAIQNGVDVLRTNPSKEALSSLTKLSAFTTLTKAFNTFAAAQKSPLAQLWLSYIDMASLLLKLIRASREGDWDGHLAAVRKLLPWMFAYDHVNYSRYMSLYWCEMHQLETARPDVHRHLSVGEFCVQRTENPFSQIPVDQTIEQTVNRHTKTKGGIIGFSRNPGAVQQWIVNAHQRAEIARICLDMAGLSSALSGPHKEASMKRIQTDEKDVENVLATLTTWHNPFTDDPDEPMSNISSGVTAPEAVSEALLCAYTTGEQAFANFVQHRLVNGTVPFHDVLPKLKLETFSSLTKTSRVTVKGKDVIVRADRNFFARMLVVAQSRAMDLRRVFQFSLGPLPWSLATPDGQLAKTTKSTLLNLLEKDVAPQEEVPANAAWVVDAMALLQSISSPPRTFADLAETVFTMATTSFRTHGPRVDFVVDRYPDISIKAAERSKRAKSGSLAVNITHRTQKCPSQWKKFLSVGHNKTTLVQFLLREWSSNVNLYAPRLHNRQLFVTSQASCVVLSSPDGQTIHEEAVPELTCTHEEADTRLLLHASHASNAGYADVVIKSPDTDVAVLACHFSWDIQATLFFRTGTKNRKRTIHINQIAAKQGRAVCQALPALHALTGCDSTSAFKGRGKKVGLALIQHSSSDREAVARLGVSLDLSEDVLSRCEAFVCHLYGYKDHASVNDVRYEMFAAKAAQSFQLPPTQDALGKHILRANYQAAVWRNALVAQPALPGPDGHGWCVADGQITIDWMDQQPAPSELLELVSCSCLSGCTSNRCSCFKAALPCTDACRCANCANSASSADAGDCDRDLDKDCGGHSSDESDKD